MEESNRKLAILKAEKDVTKGAFFPVLNVGNKHVAGDKVRDKQKDMQDMESTLKELLDQSSFRLLELKHLHHERIEILKNLSNLQVNWRNILISFFQLSLFYESSCSSLRVPCYFVQ
nr:E3 ubiquitin-protein ligase BRE1-like 1 [Ipomoea batatas]